MALLHFGETAVFPGANQKAGTKFTIRDDQGVGHGLNHHDSERESIKGLSYRDFSPKIKLIVYQNILSLKCCRLALLLIVVLGGICQAATIQPSHTILSLNYSNTDTTVGKTSQVNSIPDLVSDYQTVAGGDVFYIFLVVNAGTMAFTATPAVGSGFDVAVYLSNGDAIENSGLASGVIDGSDAEFEGDADTFTISNLNPGTYYVGVDSFYSSGSAGSPNRHQGEYTLTVTGTAVLGDPFAPVPEPSTWLTIGAGVVAIGLNRWRRG